MTAIKYEVHTSADPMITRIIPELAKEIGLNESIVLLQIAFWIKTANHEHDGEYWTFQSLREMREKAFSYWSVDTISRTVNVLIDKQFIKSRDDLNKRQGDKTRWFALNIEALSKLQSITVVQVETKGVRKSDRVSESHTTESENRTTLPESTPENTEKESFAPKPETTPLSPALALAVDNAAEKAYQPIDNDTAAMMQGEVLMREYEAVCKQRGAPQTIQRSRHNKRIAAQYYRDGYLPDEVKQVVEQSFDAGKVIAFAFLSEKLSQLRAAKSKASKATENRGSLDYMLKAAS